MGEQGQADRRGLFTLDPIWHFDPAEDRLSTCKLIVAPCPPRKPLREIRQLQNFTRNSWSVPAGKPPRPKPPLCSERCVLGLFSPCHEESSMPITTSSDTNTFMVLGVQPTPSAAQGFVSYTFPAAPPNPSGLLQCDSDGTFRWVTPAGVPLGESRHFTGSMTAVCAGETTEVRMTRVTGNKSSILVSVPANDPTGCYVEATVRAYGSGIDGVTAVRATCGLLYSGGAWTVTNTSYLGDHQDTLFEMRFAVDTLLGGIGGVYIVVTGIEGLRVDSDIAVYSAPSAS